MRYFLKNEKGFLSLLGLLFTLAIILFVCYIMINTYLRKPISDKSTEKVISEQNIDTSSYQSIVDTTRKRVQDIEKQAEERQNQLLENTK